MNEMAMKWPSAIIIPAARDFPGTGPTVPPCRLTHVPNITKLRGENIARHEKEVGGHGGEETKPGTSNDRK